IASLLFFFSWFLEHRVLHSFPTRRSSDLHFVCARRARGRDRICARSRLAGTRERDSPIAGRGSNGIGGDCRRRNRSGSRSRVPRSEEHTSELQSRENLVCRLLLEKKKKKT